MVDDLEDVGRADALRRLVALVVVHKDNVRALKVEQVALREHTDVSSLLVEQRIVADTLFRNRALYVLDAFLRLEGDKALAAHDMAHRDRLTDDLGAGICVERRGDDGNAVFRRQLADGARNLGAEADDDAAGVHLDGAQLALVAVAENDHVVRRDVVLEDVRVRRRNNDAAFLERLLQLTRNERAVQNVNKVSVAGFRLCERVRVLVLHVEPRDVAQREQTFQVAVLIDNGEGLNVVFVHVVPCAAQGHLRVDTRDLAVLHIAQARLERGDIARRLDAEVFEHEFGFRVDVSRAAGDIFFTGQDTLEVRVADRRTDRVRIRIAVSDNKDWAHVIFCSFL